MGKVDKLPMESSPRPERPASAGQSKDMAPARSNVDAGEWDSRVALAACYRLVALYGMDDIVYTHISARVPGGDDHFLINPFGTMFEEITASALVRIDRDGKVVSPHGARVNEAGFTIHSAVHAARPDIGCVIHTHTRAGMAVSALEGGLLPLCQKSMLFHDRLAYHEYRGVAFDLAERASLVADLGRHKAMMLRNHGLLTCGVDCAEAFSLMYQLELACRVQLDVLASNRKHRLPSDTIAEKAAHQLESYPIPPSVLEWPALLRKLDRVDKSYRE
jgi:ribulose-5-phosphate 4-epimerase/fuculose-1-phosphate aldolase